MPKIAPFSLGEHLSATKLNRMRATLLSARDALGVEEQTANYSARLRVPGSVTHFVVGGVPAQTPGQTTLANCAAWHHANTSYKITAICERDDGSAWTILDGITLFSGNGFSTSRNLEGVNNLYVRIDASNLLAIARDAAITNVWRVTLRVSVRL